VAILRLDAVEFVDVARWRWVLTDETSGEVAADHEVRLDASCWQFDAFADPVGYLSWHAAPDRRTRDEARIVAELGEWIASKVLGPVAGAMALACPVTVWVAVPEGAEELLTRPLELAHVGGKPLAAQGVTLVMEAGRADSRVSPVGERLRVLGLFSMPEGGQALNMRRERRSLVELMKEIAVSGKAADVRVLQYGVTRDRLRDVIADGEGWDVIHVSGHGSPGRLLLETDDGKPDRVTAAQLTELLAPARGRLKLVTISACWSAAVAAAEQRQLLGLPIPAKTAPQQAARSHDAQSGSGSLATELASHLGCAVLAMRYPVRDEFATALGGKLYGLLAEAGHPLPQALGMALGELASRPDGTGPDGTTFPALSLATPALFGSSAIDLRLPAPDRGPVDEDGALNLKMAGFPPQPDRFVGRTAVMARTSAALARESKTPGMLLYGMPGGGKTACALELAYGHEHAFDQLVWYKAPDEGMDITGALTDFALTLERYLDGFQLAHALVDENQLAAFLPRLTELLEQRRLLIVIDNAESLLSQDRQWRDERWGKVIGALTTDTRLGRLVLTSRRVPAGLTRLGTEAVDALSADESLLLTRELPHFRALSHGEIPGIEPHVARRLARHVLNVAQGHPKLLELAEGQAADPERLAELVEAGGQAWRARGGLPDGFFTTGDTTASGADYLHVLTAWTKAVTGTLAPGERDLFWFLCCLEEADRERHMLDGNWADLWTRLERDGEPPRWDEALASLVACGLTGVRDGTRDYLDAYPIHPGVAAAGRAGAGRPFQEAVDEEAATYWVTNYKQASGDTVDGLVLTDILVRAGLAGVPYLIRQQRWGAAALMLESAFLRNPSRSNAAAMMPAIKQITDHDPSQASVLARILEVTHHAAAGSSMRASLNAHVDEGDYWAASAVAAQLMYHCLNSGQLAEALAFANRAIGHARQAGMGPWTQLLAEIQLLQVHNAMGQYGHVLHEVQRLREHALTLPSAFDPNDPAPVWEVHEKLLDTGRYAERKLGRWNNALDLSREIITSMHNRRAPAVEIAKAAFNCYEPLLQLGRTDDSLALLKKCRHEFQQANDVKGLGMAMSALADVEDKRGHGDAAIALVRDALRYIHMAGDVTSIAVSYHHLGGYLRDYDRQSTSALACHLAAALILSLAGAANSDVAVSGAAIVFQDFGKTLPPQDVADLCRQVGDIPGTDLPGLIATLSPDPDTAEQALRDHIAQAQALATDPAEGDASA
jgi:tetratricopeptide (TPR) repeat protein